MTIQEYNKFGRIGRKDWFWVLCENPKDDNAPPLNKEGLAYAVNCLTKCDEDGFYACCVLHFSSPDDQTFDASAGGLGRSVKFNPTTEEFRFGPPKSACDSVRPVDFDFYFAASRGSIDDLKQLLDRGANPDAPIYDAIGDDLYAIHEAALNPDIKVLEFIVSLGVDPCRFDFWGRQPLAFAARKNSIEIVRYLVELGNDPCNVDCDGKSVLAESALNPDIGVVEYLISQGAEVDAGAEDRTELGYALRDGTRERIRFFMDRGSDLECAMLNNAPWAPLENLRFVLENGFDPNTFDWGEYRDGHREKLIDCLDPKRQALFMEFGGRIHWANAMKADSSS